MLGKHLRLRAGKLLSSFAQATEDEAGVVEPACRRQVGTTRKTYSYIVANVNLC